MLQGSQVTIITIYITIANEHKYSIFFTKHNIFTIFLNVSFEWVKNRKVVEDILNWSLLQVKINCDDHLQLTIITIF